MSTLRKFRNQRLLYSTDGTETGGGTDTSSATDTGATADTSQTADAAGTSTSTADGATDSTSDNAETFDRKYVEGLRREAASLREKAKTEAAAAAETARTELAQSIGKAIGLVKDEEITVDSLTNAVGERDTTITEQGSTIKSLRIENSLLKKADKLDADLEALLDSRTFTDKVNALDPASDDFDSLVESLVKETVASNPSKYKRVQVAASTGSTQHTGETETAGASNSIDDLRKERQKRRGTD